MKNTEELKRIGAELKQLREEQGITLYRIEKETGLNFRTLKAIETGSYGCSLDTILTYLEQIQISIYFKKNN